MTTEEVQGLMDATFGRLTFFSRDLDLDEHLIAKYEPQQIIMERGFTDASYKVGGMSKNCRYLIASSHAKDLSKFGPSANFGHISLASGAYFKVLDIHKENGKTQILLLHIPEEAVLLFAKSSVNVEEKVVAQAKEIFAQFSDAAPLEALQSTSWLKRTSLPLGINSKGELFFDSKSITDKEFTIQQDEGIVTKASNTKTPKKKGLFARLFGRK